MNNWILTDNDSFQIRRGIDGNFFEQYQIDAVAPPRGKEQLFRVSHAIIYISDIDLDEMMDCYGYDSLNTSEEEHEEGWKGILAECDFEITSQNGEYLTWEAAKKLICELSGYCQLPGH